MSIHVMPVNDKVIHSETVDCMCGPEAEWVNPDSGETWPGGPLVVHHSLDGRERTEGSPLPEEVLVMVEKRWKGRKGTWRIVPSLERDKQLGITRGLLADEVCRQHPRPTREEGPA